MKTRTPKVMVSGAALTAFNRRIDGSSFRDWASTAFQDALLMSTLDHHDIDALFVSSESDFFTLQLNPSSVLASDLGLTGAATMRVEGGGASGQLAVHAATRAIQSGQVKHAAVVGVDPSASQLPASAIKSLYGYSFDAWSEGMTGVTATALYALSYQVFAKRLNTTPVHLAQITIQNRANALENPRAHLGRAHTIDEINQAPMIASPYCRLHCSPLSDGAAALILSASDAIPVARNSAPSIAGIGAASDHVHLGSRADPGRFAAKTRAMQRATSEAGITPDKIGIAEIYDAYAGAQIQALDALGLSKNLLLDLESTRYSRRGSCPINVSGGLLGQGAPVGAIGVGQTATCAQLLEGRYNQALQPDNLPRYALADTHGGVCTTAAITILETGRAM